MKQIHCTESFRGAERYFVNSWKFQIQTFPLPRWRSFTGWIKGGKKQTNKQKKQCKALGIVMTSLWHKREAETNSRFFCICYPNNPHISILHIVKWTNLSKMMQCSHDERIGYCFNIRKRIYNTCFCCQGEILEGNGHILMRLEVKQMWTHRGSRSW